MKCVTLLKEPDRGHQNNNNNNNKRHSPGHRHLDSPRPDPCRQTSAGVQEPFTNQNSPCQNSKNKKIKYQNQLNLWVDLGQLHESIPVQYTVLFTVQQCNSGIGLGLGFYSLYRIARVQRAQATVHNSTHQLGHRLADREYTSYGIQSGITPTKHHSQSCYGIIMQFGQVNVRGSLPSASLQERREIKLHNYEHTLLANQSLLLTFQKKLAGAFLSLFSKKNTSDFWL